jgi:hypothetical protein
MKERWQVVAAGLRRALGAISKPTLRGLVGVLVVYAAIGTTMILMLPKYAPADEPRHVAYSLLLAQGTLPKMSDPLPYAALQTGKLNSGNAVAAANHPPLFYLLTAPTLSHASKLGKMDLGVRQTRFFMLALGAACIVYVFRILRRLVPDKPGLAVITSAMFATLPVFVNTCSIVYNDSLGILTTLGSFHAALVVWQSGPSRARLVVTGVWVSLAMFTRISGLFMVAPSLLLTALGVLTHGEGSLGRRFVRATLVGLGLVTAMALVSGWFYLRNIRLYGDISGASEALKIFRRKPHGEPDALLLSAKSWMRLHHALWGRLAGGINLTGTIDKLIAAISLLPLLGVPKLVFDARHRIVGFFKSRSAVSYALSILAFACVVLPMFHFHSKGGNLNARYLLPILWLPLLLLAAGLSSTRFAALPQWGTASFVLVSFVTLELYGRALSKRAGAEIAVVFALKGNGIASHYAVYIAMLLAVGLGLALIVGAIGELHGGRIVSEADEPGGGA